MFKLLLLPTCLVAATTLLAEPLHVYFGTGGPDTKGIYRSSFDPQTGDLSPAVVAAEIGTPGFLALHPNGAYLYAVANDGSPCVAAYRILPDGGLELLNTEPTGDGLGTHIAVHPTGRFLITAQYGGGSVAVFPLETDGRVRSRWQLIEHQGGSGIVPRRQDKPHPHWTGFSPDGRFAFVPDLGLDQIVIYRVDAPANALVPHGIAQSIPGGGPRHMRFSTDGRFIYLLNELALSVTTFAYAAQAGTAERLSTTPALSPETKAEEAFNSASEILTHPNGRFIYSANRGHDSVTAFQANPTTGTLIPVEVEHVRGSFPRNINLDPHGRWLLAAGQHSNTVAVFAIDPISGKLQFQTNKVISLPSPICILFVEIE